MLKRVIAPVVSLLFLTGTASAQVPGTISAGDTAWMLVASALVMLMTLPGLALFYGGLAKRKDILNVIAMSFVTFCIVSVLWVIFGYSMVFSASINGLVGGFSKLFLHGITVNSVSYTIPELLFVVYQLTFAAITVALASGAYIERIKLSSWILFSLLWFTLVYVPVAHWVWGGGFLAKMGVLDFAGGIVVHLNAGVAALVGALVLGKRVEKSLLPNNLVFTVTGLGLLWFGWFGFNAGSALAANGLAAAAFLNTNTASAVAALAWMFTEWIVSKKPTVLGMASGAVAGLATITPTAGYVNIGGAIVIGLLAGSVLYFAVAVVKQRLGYDDTLDVFGIHGVGGIMGTILLGFLADPAINPVAKGLFYGNPNQLKIQLIGVAIPLVYDIVVTFVIFMVIKATIGLRVSTDEELNGLDESQHGEKAYNM